MASNTGNKVLIVEDDMILSMVIEQMVGKLGFQVVDKIKNGEKAIESALYYKPDVILMDIRLDGDLDGIDAVKKIHASKKIPIIYITGNNDKETRQRANKTRHIDFLVKPVDENTLDIALNEIGLNAMSSTPDY